MQRPGNLTQAPRDGIRRHHREKRERRSKATDTALHREALSQERKKDTQREHPVFRIMNIME